MQRFLNLLVVLLAFLVFSCSSSHSSNDSDILPDSDINTQDSETQDDDSDTQEFEIIDDSDEEIPDESSSVVDRYKRCYDEIPDDPYEGLFADPKIESQIKKSLGYEDDYELTEDDLEKVTEIVFSTKDLRGVEKLVNLEYAKFDDKGGGGNIYDFTPLSKLKKLKKIRIRFRPPEQISPDEHVVNMTCLDGTFSLLTNLETLEIEDTKLKDVSPIEQLTNLKSLQLGYYNKIESLPKNIGNLQKLEFFSFSGNNIKDITPLKSLTNLRELFFHDNYVEDISAVKSMVDLTRLGAQGNKIKDISAVTNLEKLTYLGLSQNQIEEIPEEIINLKELQTLELSFNDISNLPELKGLDSLDTLWFDNNDLNDKDLIKLDRLEHVQFLDVALNKITKVPVLKNMKSLYELLLQGNNITDLSGFADNESFPTLKRLDVGSNKIDNVEAFRKREGLSSLWVDKNCIKDFSPLEELKERGTYVGGMNEQLESCEDTE